MHGPFCFSMLYILTSFLSFLAIVVTHVFVPLLFCFLLRLSQEQLRNHREANEQAMRDEEERLRKRKELILNPMLASPFDGTSMLPNSWHNMKHFDGSPHNHSNTPLFNENNFTHVIHNSRQSRHVTVMESWVNVMDFLDAQSLARASRVCRFTRHLTDESTAVTVHGTALQAMHLWKSQFSRLVLVLFWQQHKINRRRQKTRIRAERTQRLSRSTSILNGNSSTAKADVDEFVLDPEESYTLPLKYLGQECTTWKQLVKMLYKENKKKTALLLELGGEKD